MAFTIRIFQLEENIGGTDVQMVAGTLKTYDSDTASNDFIPDEIPASLRVTIELEDGRSRIDSFPMIVSELADDYFAGYTRDNAHETPWAVTFLHKGTGTAIFHGFIDPATLKFDRRTNQHSFEVFSWEKMLNIKGIPAREILQADFTRDVTSDDDPGVFYIPATADGYATSTTVQVGDVLVADTEIGEYRAHITSVTAAGSETKLETAGSPNVRTAGSGSAGVTTTVPYGPVVNGNNQNILIQLTVVDAILYQALKINPNIIVRITKGVNTNYLRVARAPFSGTPGIVFDEDQETIIIPLGPVFDTLVNGVSPTMTTWSNATGVSWEVDVLSLAVVGDLTGSKRARILGKDFYGYSPANPETGVYYQASQIVNAMFSLQDADGDFGVLRHLFSGVTLDGSLTAGQIMIHPFTELPDDPMQALRVLLATISCFMKIEYTIDGGNLPRFGAHLISRTDCTSASLGATAVAGVIDFQESSVDDLPIAVVVRPNLPYLKLKDAADPVGFYFDGIDGLTAAQRLRRFVPSGEGVLEVTVAAIPSYTGDVFGGYASPIKIGSGSETRSSANIPKARNDEVLKVIARQYYAFMRDCSKRGVALINQQRFDLLGTFASMAEVDGGRSILGLSVSTGLETGETKIDGRIGEYAEVINESPVAIITGQTNIIDIDNDGFANIRLSGLSSYDPADQNLTYSWKVNAVVQSTNAYLDHQVASNASYTVELTVTDSDLNTSITSVTVYVISIDAQGGGFTIGNVFRMGRHQKEVGGIRYGVLRLYPLWPINVITSVKYRTDNKEPDEPTVAGDYNLTATLNTTGFDAPYYECQVALHPDHASIIEVRAEFQTWTSIPAQYYEVGFDHDVNPSVTPNLYIVGQDVYLAWTGDEDLNSILYDKSTVSVPANATTAAAGQTSDGIIIHSGLLTGQNVYVRVRGLATDPAITSPEDWTGSIAAPPAGTLAPTAVGVPTQAGATGTMSLTLVDPNSLVTKTTMWKKTLGADAESLIPLYPDTTFPFETQGSVTLHRSHNSIIRWEVEWLDYDGNTQTIGGSHTFDLDRFPGIIDADLTYDPLDGTVDLHVTTDEDATFIKYGVALNAPPLTLPSSASGSTIPNVYTFSGAATDATDTLYVKLQAWNGTPPSGDEGGEIVTLTFQIPVDTYPPQIREEVDTTPTVGTLTLTFDDPQSRITALYFRTKAGIASWSAWVLDDYPANPPYSAQVTTDEKHLSMIAYKVLWDDDYGNTSEIHGVVPIDRSEKPEVAAILMDVENDGTVNVDVIVDKDTDIIYYTSAVNSTPTNPTTGSSSAVPSGNVASFSLASYLDALEYACVKVLPYNTPANLGGDIKKAQRSLIFATSLPGLSVYTFGENGTETSTTINYGYSIINLGGTATKQAKYKIGSGGTPVNVGSTFTGNTSGSFTVTKPSAPDTVYFWVVDVGTGTTIGAEHTAFLPEIAPSINVISATNGSGKDTVSVTLNNKKSGYKLEIEQTTGTGPSTSDGVLNIESLPATILYVAEYVSPTPDPGTRTYTARIRSNRNNRILDTDTDSVTT